jgi:hypothetical protein
MSGLQRGMGPLAKESAFEMREDGGILSFTQNRHLKNVQIHWMMKCDRNQYLLSACHEPGTLLGSDWRDLEQKQ